MKGLTDIPGILVGHASDYDGLTGCAVVLCENGQERGEIFPDRSVFGLESRKQRAAVHPDRKKRSKR